MKAAHIEAERAKVSRFRPKITHENPDNLIHLPIGDVNPEPGIVQRDTWGMLIGDDKPVQRLLQAPFSWLVVWLRKTHDLRGPCARKECAFRNATPEDVEKARALKGVNIAKGT